MRDWILPTVSDLCGCADAAAGFRFVRLRRHFFSLTLAPFDSAQDMLSQPYKGEGISGFDKGCHSFR